MLRAAGEGDVGVHDAVGLDRLVGERGDELGGVGALGAAGCRHDLPVLGWATPDAVADLLNAEYGAAFVGNPTGDTDIVVAVDRTAQLSAMGPHVSQRQDNTEYRRWIA